MIFQINCPNEFYNYPTFINILQSEYHYIIFGSLGLKMALWLQVWYCHLLGVCCVFIVHMLISSFFLILYDKIYRSIPIPDHAKTSGYTPEAAAKMLKHLIAILWKTTGESTEQLKIWILPMPDSLTIKESCSLPCWGCDFTSNTLLSCAKRHARALQKVTIIQWEKCPIFTPFC